MATWVLLALAGAGGLAVWFALLGLLALATRPTNGEPEPETMELAPETPAVANLLVNCGELKHSAVPATLLDLAGRKVLALDQVGVGRFVCRVLTTKGSAPLTPYERQLLDHVERLAHGGVVPCEALSTGPEDDSRRWWRQFEKAVVAEARSAGLLRDRWGRAVRAVLGALAVGPAAAIGLVIMAIPSDSTDANDSPLLGAIGVSAMVWVALMAVPQMLRQHRLTAAGREASGRWLGVQAHLRHDPIFPTLPPPAVAIWDRYLGYGAALGVSVDAVRALPLGSESDTEAWSSVGGTWRLVQVRYGRRLPPGWGQPPARVFFSGLLLAAGSGLVLFRLGPSAVEAVWEEGTSGSLPEAFPFETVFTWVVSTIAVALGFVLVRASVMVVLGGLDLWSRRETEGRVLRVRREEEGPTFVAVDDGTRDRIHAWAVPTHRFVVAQGDDVRVVASPRLGWVARLDRVRDASPKS